MARRRRRRKTSCSGWKPVTKHSQGTGRTNMCRWGPGDGTLMQNPVLVVFPLTAPLCPSPTQEAACWALNNLLMYHSSLHEKIGDEDGQ